MIVIDYQNRKPIYEQIVERFQMLIVKGIMEADTKMPSVSGNRTFYQSQYHSESVYHSGTAGIHLSGKGKGEFCFRKSSIERRTEDRIF